MNEEIEREVQQEERNQHTTGIIFLIIVSVLLMFYIFSEDRNKGVWPDEIDDPCIAYNC